MELGAFSVSLNVADLAKSQAFYEALGFKAVAGDAAQGWRILRNGATNVGLFQGMFERNMLTFNPGWDAQGNALTSFVDVRDIQRHLRREGVALQTETDEAGTGPGNIVLIDPDGNPVLIDQHV